MGRALIERTENHQASATRRTPVSFGECDVLIGVRDDLSQGSSLGGARPKAHVGDADGWELSPAFDVNPNPQPGGRHLSTAIDRNTLADVDDLLATALLYRLNDTDALGVLRQVRDAVSTWDSVAARNAPTKNACAAMASAFANPAASRTADLLD